MPTEPNISTSSGQETFLNTAAWSATSDGANPYGDFFQETSDGNISIGAKAQKSGLEIATSILWYIVPIAVVLAILGGIHVFIRTQESSSFAENYSFICPYMNMGVNAPDKSCKTITMIQKDYTDRLARLRDDIVAGLTEYIPIKVSKNIIDASPEKTFIIDTYTNKVHVNEIMSQFEKLRTASSYSTTNNIQCNGISITNGDTLAAQCTIYGTKIGNDNQNGQLGSARIEALTFLESLANTARSQFILLNPPSSLNVESIQAGEDTVNPIFSTKTTVQIQVRYVPLHQKS